MDEGLEADDADNGDAVGREAVSLGLHHGNIARGVEGKAKG